MSSGECNWAKRTTAWKGVGGVNSSPFWRASDSGTLPVLHMRGLHWVPSNGTGAGVAGRRGASGEAGQSAGLEERAAHSGRRRRPQAHVSLDGWRQARDSGHQRTARAFEAAAGRWAARSLTLPLPAPHPHPAPAWIVSRQASGPLQVEVHLGEIGP